MYLLSCKEPLINYKLPLRLYHINKFNESLLSFPIIIR